MAKVSEINIVVSVGVLMTMIIVIAESQLVHNDPVVETAQGFIAGKSRRLHSGRGIYSFMGVPYAEPPIGELRFRAPVPKKQWTGILEAFHFGSMCVQNDINGGVTGDEDCLFLNVYTPQLPTNRTHLLPVMVFVHGGSFVMGSSDCFKPDYLLDKDLILVTCNYRLGPLGFLSTGDSNAPGNMGLKDLQQALRWIRENIPAFGGDPNSVTLDGQSAGASLVHYLTVSDKVEPLFHRYILHSGSAIHAWAFHLNPKYTKFAEELAEKNNCPTSDSKSMVDCLRKLSAQQLQSTKIHSDSIMSLFSIAIWRPTNEPESEEAILTRPPWELFKENRAKDKPFILSCTTREAMYTLAPIFLNEELKRNFYRSRSDNVISDTLLSFEMANFSNMSTIVKKCMDMYWNGDMEYYQEHFVEGFENFFTDAQLLFPLNFAMHERLQDITVPYYFLWFDYRGTFSYTSRMTQINDNLGATHTDDLIYLAPHDARDFGMPDNLRMSEADYEIVDIMVDAWSSFVINGCPVSKNLAEPDLWRPFADNNSVLRVGRSTKPVVTLENSFFPERMKLWHDIARKYIYTTSISEDP